MSATTAVTHAPGPDGLLGSTALCGATTETHDLRLSDFEVDCAVCLDLEPVNTLLRPSEAPCPIQGHDHMMSECSGNI